MYISISKVLKMLYLINKIAGISKGIYDILYCA